MKINTDINILGGLKDFNLILHLIEKSDGIIAANSSVQMYSSVKTDKSYRLFGKAIEDNFLKYRNSNIQDISMSILNEEQISPDSLLQLFWNASSNNDLIHYLNQQSYFPAFYSGRLILKKDDASACIKDLKQSEQALGGWSVDTIDTVSSKYLTLLKKFNLLEGSQKKTIIHPYLNDKMFVMFVYWLTAIETKSNLLDSEWLAYSFSEKPIFIERLMQKKFSQYFQIQYTGDKLKIETTTPYSQIYYALN